MGSHNHTLYAIKTDKMDIKNKKQTYSKAADLCLFF